MVLPGGALKEFRNELLFFCYLDLKVSDLLEKYATLEARAAHIDLADWLIEFFQDNK